MSDVLLSALLGSAVVQSVSNAGVMQNATQQIPPEIANLPQGSLLKGFVVNRDATGNPILRTDRGDLMIRSEVFLKTGSEVVIRVNTQQGQYNARIISVDNIPLKDVIMQQQSQPQGDRVLQSSMLSPFLSRSAAAANSGQSAPPPLSLQGIVLKPVSFGSEQQTAQTVASILKLPVDRVPSLDKGMVLQFNVLSSQLPAAAGGSAAQPASPAQFSLPLGAGPDPKLSLQYAAYGRQTANPQTSLTSSGPAGIGANQPSSAIPPAASAQLATATSVNNAQALPASGGSSPLTTAPTATTPAPYSPGGTAPANIAPAAGNLIYQPPNITNRPGLLTAKVIGHEAGGETVLRSAIGTIKLFTASAPPVGTTLQLELTAIPVASLTAASAPIGTAPITSSGSHPVTVAANFHHEWESLERVSHLLQQENPARHEALMARVPNTKSNMVNSVLFFISALRSGDIRQWLGQSATRQLEQQSRPLMQQLNADFANLRVLAHESPDINWHILLFPLMHDDELHQARLYVRKDKEEGQQREGEDSRFVLEITLSQLGELQIDGLVHKSSGKHQFDLVIRSQDELESEIQNDIQAIYRQASEIAGFSGHIQFKSGLHRFVRPLDEYQPPTSQTDGSILA